MSLIEVLSDLLLLHTVPEEPALEIDAKYTIMTSKRLKRNSLAGYEVQTRLGGIRLPYNLSVYDNVTAYDCDVTVR